MKYLRIPVQLILLILIFCLVAAPGTAPRTGTGYYPVLGGVQKIKWLLRDEFTTALATGSVNLTAAEPGPGIRTVVDDQSKLSISDGLVLGVRAPGANGNPGDFYPAISRVAGKICYTKSTFATNNAVAFGYVKGYSPYSIGPLMYQSLGLLRVYELPTNDVVVYTLTNGVVYKYFSVLKAAGAAHLLKVANGYPLLLYIGITSNDASYYPGIFATANHASIANFKPIRIPQTLWLPTPLLSTSGAMTWPVTDGLGHAETTGLGSGGSGLALLDAGTWSVAGGYVLNTPVAGGEKVVDGVMANGDAWGEGTGWDVGVTTPGVATKTAGTASTLDNNGGIAAIVGSWYKLGVDLTCTAGALNLQYGSNNLVIGLGTTGSYFGIGRVTTSTTRPSIYGSAAFAGTADNFSVKPLPISSLITNVQLSTTDVLAEEVIHAFTLGTQVGIVQSDRSFAAKAVATAAAGQAVISLKEVTGVGGVGLAITDSITIAGTTYTIASVTGGANVAYNDTLKTQTVTLGANLGAEVLADAKVGLDWAAWNGSLTYFDGAGNIKLDEVKAGVYTNRGSTATTFAADKRFIVRKIGSEYRIFYNEALVGAAISTVDAASMIGKYWGLFSTLPANTITSAVIHDTGNVTNSHGILDKYSQDTSSLMLPKEYCPDTYWQAEVANG